MSALWHKAVGKVSKSGQENSLPGATFQKETNEQCSSQRISVHLEKRKKKHREKPLVLSYSNTLQHNDCGVLFPHLLGSVIISEIHTNNLRKEAR